MKILFIVGTAKDVFIYNLAKWLKRTLPDISIDIFEFYPSNNNLYTNDYYNLVESPTYHWSSKIKGLRSIIIPFHAAKSVDTFIDNKYYDIIHCHWITSSVVLTKNLKQHCKKLYISFWGGEFDVQQICFSKALYFRRLNKFISNVDGVINSKEYEQVVYSRFSNVSNYYYGNLGSSSMDILCDIMLNTSKSDAKKLWSFPQDKLSIMIGYSGKPLHQHLKVIESLSRCYQDLHNFIHLVAPMTRDASMSYVTQVKSSLDKSRFSYTLISGEFLTDAKIAQLRYATDIVMQMSEFDGFSRSIIECLTARAILIYGSWLNYEERLKSNNYKAYMAESFSDSVNILKDIIANYPIYLKEIEKNYDSGYMYTWENCIKSWALIYNQSI